MPTSVVSDEDVDPVEFSVARTRSSHFPRIASRLAPTRCVGVHRLVPVGKAGAILLPVVSGVTEEAEPDRESVPTPPREDVRSKRRVW